MSKSIECTIPRVNPKVNYGLWMTMMCQCRLILGKKKILVSDVDNGGGKACVRAESKWEIFVTSSQFGYESETAPEK